MLCTCMVHVHVHCSNHVATLSQGRPSDPVCLVISLRPIICLAMVNVSSGLHSICLVIDPV